MDPGGGFAFACFSTCPGLGRIVYGASSWFPNNVACNFPVNLLYIEIVSLQFQRFWVMRKIRSTELHATFGRAAQRLPLNRTCQGLGESPGPRPWGSCRARASSVGELPCPGLVPTEQGARASSRLSRASGLRPAQARNRASTTATSRSPAPSSRASEEPRLCLPSQLRLPLAFGR